MAGAAAVSSSDGPSQQLRGRTPAGLFLVIEIAKLLAALVLNNKGGSRVLYRPGRRETAHRCRHKITSKRNK
jgi:hypothetical protein